MLTVDFSAKIPGTQCAYSIKYNVEEFTDAVESEISFAASYGFTEVTKLNVTVK